MVRFRRLCVVGVAGCLLLIPSLAVGQTTASAIAGVVTDSSGGVVPGVMVEASSPALIERVRSAVTDTEGQYRIVDLRPGTYVVTFTLSGFNTLKREGIVLTTGFTAPVSAQLTIGALAETITVSGASPVVDTLNTAQITVITREVADSIPTGKDFHNYLALIPGMKGMGLSDVGGQDGQIYAGLTIHGGASKDHTMQVDGMSIMSMTNIHHSANYVADGNIQEFAFDIAGNSAEVESGGVRVNMIPREGSNSLRSTFFANVSPTRLQSSNLSESVKALGVTGTAPVSKLWQANPTLGGPILRDKLWFFGTYTWNRADHFAANAYHNKDVAAWDYVADLSRPVINDQYNYDASVRTTWQVSSRNKVNFYYSANYTCQCNRATATTAPEAAFAIVLTNRLYQATWSAPVTGRLLLDAGVSSSVQDNHWQQRSEAVAPRISDSGRNITYRASNTDQLSSGPVITFRGAATYVTGSHNTKVGFTLVDGTWNKDLSLIGNKTFAAVNGIPSSVTYSGWPVTSSNNIRPNLGIYAQDQWTWKARLTMNTGLRFDYFRQEYPEQTVPPTEFVRVVRSFPELEVTKWTDLSPRLGLVYDLFGNSKTALKATLNRYVLQQGVEYAVMANPIESNNSMTRQWNDSNNDRVVQGDPFNPALNEELGVSQNLNFGKPIVTYRFDREASHGFGNRPSQWEFSAGIQHELVPRVSVNATYFRRIYDNFLVTDNLLIGNDDYDTYCVTAPVDPRLPADVSGQPICGLYDLNPLKVGQSDNVGVPASRFGKQQSHWDGGDVTVNARLAALNLQGGLSTGKTMTDNCEIKPQSPSTRFCHTETRFLTDVTALAAYTLPWQDIQVSGTYRNLAGPQVSANATFSNAQIRPSLKRDLSSGSNVTVNLLEPGTVYEGRQQQLDLRVAKTFRIRGKRVQGMLDLYNAQNSDQITSWSNTYGVTTGTNTGSAWRRPTAIIAPRIVKFGVQANF
jgi:hypothetical protein